MSLELANQPESGPATVTMKASWASLHLWDLNFLFCYRRCNNIIMHLIGLLQELNKTAGPTECLAQNRHLVHGQSRMAPGCLRRHQFRAWGYKENSWSGGEGEGRIQPIKIQLCILEVYILIEICRRERTNLANPISERRYTKCTARIFQPSFMLFCILHLSTLIIFY